MTAAEKFAAMGSPVAKVLADQAGVSPISLEALKNPHQNVGNSVNVILTAVAMIAVLACVSKRESSPPLPPPLLQPPVEELDGDGVAASSRTLVPQRNDLKGLPDELKYVGRHKCFKVAFRSLPHRMFKIAHYPTWEQCREAALADLVALQSRFAELTSIPIKDLREQCLLLGKTGKVARITRCTAAEFILGRTVEVPADGPFARPPDPTAEEPAPGPARLSAMLTHRNHTDSVGDTHRLLGRMRVQSSSTHPPSRSYLPPVCPIPEDDWMFRVSS